MASLLTPEFVAANGLPADPDGQRDLIAPLAQAQDRDLHRDGAAPACCRRVRASPRIVDEALGRRLDAGGRLDLGRGVRAGRARARRRPRDAAASFAGPRRRRRRHARSPTPRHLPARARATRRSIAGRRRRDRGLAQRAAGRGAGRPSLRRHGQRLHAGRDMSRGRAGASTASAIRASPMQVLAEPRPRRSGRLGHARRPRGMPGSPDQPRGSAHEPRAALPDGRAGRSDRSPQTVVDNEKYFGELDAVVGDGDFGYSLARGFENVLDDWDELRRTRISARSSRRSPLIDHQPHRRHVRADLGHRRSCGPACRGGQRRA